MGSYWINCDPALFFSKNDPDDKRLGEFSKAANIANIDGSSQNFFLWGYPDDEGIRLNGGRVGAKLAPDEIRKYFYKMTPPLWTQTSGSILDLGNLNAQSLEIRHTQGAILSERLCDINSFKLSLGGGHDYAYADGAGFIRAALKKNLRPLVLNIDAHLDVRPTDKGFNSGTPFRRLIEEFHGKFDFLEIGIQSQCNSKKHLQWLLENGGRVLSLDEIRKKSLIDAVKEQLSLMSIKADAPIWLSLDIDGISSNEAPGCSQSWTTGLYTQEILDLFSYINQFQGWNFLSIYEVSPSLDIDARTSKLAALLVHRFYDYFLKAKATLK